MKSRSYNSVGAGDKPRLGKCKSVEMESRPGGAESTAGVKVVTDIPKSGPGGAQGGGLKSPGQPPKAARPGGNQGA